MKAIIRIIQVLVGVLFIISGLVKANDPLGLSYKMQEFFELWNSSLNGGNFFLKSPLVSFFSFLHDRSLGLSVFMITLEIVAGVALLLGWMKNFILWLLLSLIVFFTFLTGYAYLSGKFTNCGCFGDCLPISPLTSFTKDIILLALIIALIWGRKWIEPVLKPGARTLALGASLAVSLLLQWYVLQYLPLKDCLPFKEGNNIAQQMKPPPGSVPDSFAIRFIYEKGGKQFEFAPENLPADFASYKFIDRKDKLVRKGNAEPAIKGFSLNSEDGGDATLSVLSEPVALLIFTQGKVEREVLAELRKLVTLSSASGTPVAVASPSTRSTQEAWGGLQSPNLYYYNTDFTVVRTAARTNPTVYVLKQGTIIHKYSKEDVAQAIGAVAELRKSVQ